MAESTWEGRMAARAAARREVLGRAEDACVEAAWQEQQQALESQFADAKDAGPPDGCHTCYEWRRHWKFSIWDWWHITDGPLLTTEMRLDTTEPGEPWEYETLVCRHNCHGAGSWESGPPIALAAG